MVCTMGHTKTKPLGETLAELRAKRGLSQRRLEEKSGVHHVMIARIETGICLRPRAMTLRRLARSLRVRMATLVEAAEASR